MPEPDQVDLRPENAENPSGLAETDGTEQRREPPGRWEGYSLSTLSIFLDRS